MESLLMFLLLALQALVGLVMFVLVLAAAAIVLPCLALFLLGDWVVREAGKVWRG